MENTGKLELTMYTQSTTCKVPSEQTGPGRSRLNVWSLTDKSMIHLLANIFSDLKNTTIEHQPKTTCE